MDNIWVVSAVEGLREEVLTFPGKLVMRIGDRIFCSAEDSEEIQAEIRSRGGRIAQQQRMPWSEVASTVRRVPAAPEGRLSTLQGNQQGVVSTGVPGLHGIDVEFLAQKHLEAAKANQRTTEERLAKLIISCSSAGVKILGQKVRSMNEELAAERFSASLEMLAAGFVERSVAKDLPEILAQGLNEKIDELEPQVIALCGSKELAKQIKEKAISDILAPITKQTRERSARSQEEVAKIVRLEARRQEIITEVLAAKKSHEGIAEQVRKELAAIRAYPFFEDMECASATFRVGVKDVTVNAVDGTPVPLGRYNMYFKFSSEWREGRSENFLRLENRDHPDACYTHPHVRDFGNSICFGAGRAMEALTHMIAEMNFGLAVQMLYTFLCGHNSRSVYIKLEDLVAGWATGAYIRQR